MDFLALVILGQVGERVGPFVGGDVRRIRAGRTSRLLRAIRGCLGGGHGVLGIVFGKHRAADADGVLGLRILRIRTHAVILRRRPSRQRLVVLAVPDAGQHPDRQTVRPAIVRIGIVVPLFGDVQRSRFRRMLVRHLEVLLLFGGACRREHASGPLFRGFRVRTIRTIRICGASACRIAVDAFLGYGVRVQVAVDVPFRQALKGPELLVGVTGHVHVLHDYLFGSGFETLHQIRRILRLVAGTPHVEGKFRRAFAVIVGVVFPCLGHLGVDGVRLTHVQHCVFGAVLIRSLGDRHSVGAILELLRGFLVHGVVVAFAVLVVSGQIGPRMRPRAGTIHLDRVLLVGQFLGIA